MNKHLNDGQLRAALDAELSLSEQQHLENCATCQARQQTVQAQVQLAASRLAFLANSPDDRAPAARTALKHLQNEIQIRKETSMFKKFFTLPLVRFGLAVVLILAIVVAIPTTRVLADQLLNLFRIQQVTVIPVDFTGMQQLTGDSVFGKQVSQLLSSSITMTQKPGDPVSADDAAQASQLTGFNVRLPKEMTPSNIYVGKAAAFTFKVDRARAQALLDESGRKDLYCRQKSTGLIFTSPSRHMSAWVTAPVLRPAATHRAWAAALPAGVIQIA
jgi:hypothetical protein